MMLKAIARVIRGRDIGHVHLRQQAAGTTLRLRKLFGDGVPDMIGAAFVKHKPFQPKMTPELQM